MEIDGVKQRKCTACDNWHGGHMWICAQCWYALACSRAVLDGGKMPSSINDYFKQEAGRGKNQRCRPKKRKVDRTPRPRAVRVSRAFVSREE